MAQCVPVVSASWPALAWCMFALGTLAGDKDSWLVYIGGVSYLAVLPLWALGMAFYLVRMRSVSTVQ